MAAITVSGAFAGLAQAPHGRFLLRVIRTNDDNSDAIYLTGGPRLNFLLGRRQRPDPNGCSGGMTSRYMTWLVQEFVFAMSAALPARFEPGARHRRAVARIIVGIVAVLAASDARAIVGGAEVA